MSRKFITKAIDKFKPEETKFYNDVIVYIGKEPDIKEFHSNFKILYDKSDYFKGILSNKDIEKKNGKYVIKEPNINPQVFDVITKYLSTGKIDITNKTGIEILNIIITSDELKLNQLVKLAENFLIEHQKFLKDDPVKIFQIIYYHKSLNNIKEFYLEMICLEPRILFDSAKFIDLPAPLLEVILKRNDLNLIEIEIWEYLIKWGLARDEILNEEASKWNREKFKILERILHKFIPLVRFYDISSEDYFDKVRPYEGIIPEKLQEENLKYYLIPGYTPNKYISRNCIESVLINPKHTACFVNWINGKIGKARYKFKLLYRASRDGNTAAAFHAKCDNKGATVVIVKIRNLDQIVGGYNPLFWDSSKTDKSTKNSFLFKFTDKNNLLSANVVYSKGDRYSVRCYVGSGPFFGYGDLYVNYYPDVWYSYMHSYPTLNLPSSFSADDYEVFQVIKT